MKITSSDLLARGPELSVSIMAADPLRLGSALCEVKSAGTTMIHIDVMDGAFCPRITVGPHLVQSIPDEFVKDCHLMVEEPSHQIDAFIDAGADIISFQLEVHAASPPAVTVDGGPGHRSGPCDQPRYSPVENIAPLLDEFELLLLLAVNPGWEGQEFIRTTSRRVALAQRLVAGRDIALGVDGGITQANIEYVASLGANVVVSGSAIFRDGQVTANLHHMQAMLRASVNA